MMPQRPIWAPNLILIDISLNHTLLKRITKYVIEQISLTLPVATIVINSHIDSKTRNKRIIKQDDYQIYKESSLKTDSLPSHMLAAGANSVYFIESEKESYKAAFANIYDIIGADIPVILIGKNIIQHIKPSHIIVPNKTRKIELQKNIKITSEISSIADFMDKKIILKNKQLTIF